MLESPHFSIDVFRKWKALLQETEGAHSMPSTDE